jgi:hypothetical protein
MFRRRNTTTPDRIPVYPSEDACHADFLYDRLVRFHLRDGSTVEAVMINEYDEPDAFTVSENRHLLLDDDPAETRRAIPYRDVAFMEYA